MAFVFEIAFRHSIVVPDSSKVPSRRNKVGSSSVNKAQ